MYFKRMWLREAVLDSAITAGNILRKIKGANILHRVMNYDKC